MEQICKNKCFNVRACDLLDCCIYRHDLINDRNINLFIDQAKEGKQVGSLRTKQILRIFELISPPEISQEQMNDDWLVGIHQKMVDNGIMEKLPDWVLRLTTKKYKKRLPYNQLPKPKKVKRYEVNIDEQGETYLLMKYGKKRYKCYFVGVTHLPYKKRVKANMKAFYCEELDCIVFENMSSYRGQKLIDIVTFDEEKSKHIWFLKDRKVLVEERKIDYIAKLITKISDYDSQEQCNFHTED